MQQLYRKKACADCSPKGTCFDKLASVLASNGGRLTRERISLLRIVCDIDGHFHPYHVLDLLREQGHTLSLTTVYRNLSLLVQAGIIRRTSVNDGSGIGGTRYEHIWDHEHHDHLMCSRCGRTIEFTYPAIEVLQEAVAKEHGFTLESHHLELTGVCPECRRKQASGGDA
ncbi:MAG TPA: Fur family transcriptional regulator [Deltaproteobacteria bacterium]|nr:Fur family transcriptional regulator [Deltaproteobacteria bacterium]HPR54681.1 Fur family transcriptional regulator [Deltaproteobacteria bacterium]HXK46655.1 Fur family transcriptional regulator [Deltaproteobacteria bacterium]